MHVPDGVAEAEVVDVVQPGVVHAAHVLGGRPGEGHDCILAQVPADAERYHVQGQRHVGGKDEVEHKEQVVEAGPDGQRDRLHGRPHLVERQPRHTRRQQHRHCGKGPVGRHEGQGAGRGQVRQHERLPPDRQHGDENGAGPHEGQGAYPVTLVHEGVDGQRIEGGVEEWTERAHALVPQRIVSQQGVGVLAPPHKGTAHHGRGPRKAV